MCTNDSIVLHLLGIFIFGTNDQLIRYSLDNRAPRCSSIIELLVGIDLYVRVQPLILSASHMLYKPLHTIIVGVGKEKRTFIDPQGNLKRQHPLRVQPFQVPVRVTGTTLRTAGPVRVKSAMNAIGTQSRDTINSGLTR